MKNKKVVNSNGEEYESISEASRLIGCNLTSLRHALKYGTMVKLLRWRYYNEDFIEPKNDYKRQVVRDDGVEYNSLKQAAIAHDVTYLAIRHAAINSTYCKGFKWSFKHQRILNNNINEYEVWKPHPTLPCKVSNIGRVKVVRATFGCKRLEGYKQVAILKQSFRVHRLIAETFIPNPDNLQQVDHIDGNKTNNNVSNLRWCTAKQNVHYYHGINV